MNWKVFFATFTAIFIAELADKTQLVGVCMSAKTGNFFSVWAGSIIAYIIVTTISIGVGLLLGKCVSVEYLRYIAGSIFIVLGVLMFMKIV